MSQSPDILTTPIGRTLIRMTIPMMFGIVSVILFNVADIWFIGQLGTAPLAAISFTFPVTFAVTSVAIGLGVGTSATLGKLIGEQNHRHAAVMASDCLTLSTLLLILLITLIKPITQPIFMAMGAEESLLGTIDAYMEIWFPASLFMVLNMVCNSVFRAAGLIRLSAIIMLVSAVLNLLLDPLLIFGLGPLSAMGVRGAAWASLLAWVITTVVAVVLLFSRRQLAIRRDDDCPPFWLHWWRALSISAPAAFSNMMTPLANGILTALVARHGAEAVAAFGVGNRIESFALLVCLALSMTLAPFISQNFGAGLLGRVRRAFRQSVYFSLCWQALVYLFLFVFAHSLADLFSDDAKVAYALALWVMIVPAGFGFQATTFLSAASFNALHRPGGALKISLFRLFVMYVPLAWLGNWSFGLVGIFVGLVCANLITAFCAQRSLRKFMLHLRKND